VSVPLFIVSIFGAVLRIETLERVLEARVGIERTPLFIIKQIPLSSSAASDRNLIFRAKVAQK
jgi:hypothetical protein